VIEVGLAFADSRIPIKKVEMRKVRSCFSRGAAENQMLLQRRIL